MTSSPTLTIPEPVDGQEGRIDVDGAEIWYRVSGAHDAPTMVLVHGSGANHWWWYAMLPALASRYRVVELDLSGHGESDHRSDYSLETWAEEVRAVIAAVSDAPVALVGHSMGGMVCGTVATGHPELVDALMVFDTSFGPDDRNPGPMGRAQRYYPTLEAILSRFTLMPPQPQPAAELVAPLARGSVRETPGGWTWKQDQTRRWHKDPVWVSSIPAGIDCPLTFVHGELSYVVQERHLAFLRENVASGLTIEMVPAVHHHLIVEDAPTCIRLVDAFMSRRP